MAAVPPLFLSNRCIWARTAFRHVVETEEAMGATGSSQASPRVHSQLSALLLGSRRAPGDSSAAGCAKSAEPAPNAQLNAQLNDEQERYRAGLSTNFVVQRQPFQALTDYKPSTSGSAEGHRLDSGKQQRSNLFGCGAVNRPRLLPIHR